MRLEKINKAILNVARSASSPISNFIITLLGVKIYGPTNWGDLVGVQLAVMLLVFAANWGNKEFLLRAFSQNPSQIASLYSKSLLTRSSLLLISLAFFFFYSKEVALLAVIYAFLQHFYGSLESLTTYFQKFKAFLFAELIGSTVIVFLILSFQFFSIREVLLMLIASGTAKLVIMLAANWSTIKRISFSFDSKMLILSFPFFLIGLSGWIQSRLDLYLVDVFMEADSLANYRVLSSAFILIQSVSALAIYPFVKHLYRLPDKVIHKGKMIIAIVGVPVVTLGTLIIYTVMEFYLNTGFSQITYWIAALSSLPSFLYMVDIFKFYKIGHEKVVMNINFAGTLINLVLSLWLIQWYGIIGAIIGTCINQWVVLFLFKYFIRGEYSVSRD